VGSVSAGGSFGDLTAQARIRTAAIAHFAREGFQKAKLRAIAATAGVSEALIFHHFDSKNGLRSACDEYVLQVLIERARTAGRAAGMQDLVSAYLSSPEEYQLHVQYMARAIQEDAPAASTFVDAMVEESEAIFRAGAAAGTMRPSSDPRALAVLNLLLGLAVLTMAPPLTRSLGYQRLGPDVLRRIAVPSFDLYTHGLYTDNALPQTTQDAEAAARQPQQK
jgi:TetR/AcrR family transcriptional regulator, regulator of cefoperazone and chloramphenicol sensitivity